jgi:hypothetical protein
MSIELERIWKEAVMAEKRYYSGNFLRKTTKHPVRLAGVRPEI